jgi:hypothetical protein
MSIETNHVTIIRQSSLMNHARSLLDNATVSIDIITPNINEPSIITCLVGHVSRES